MAIRVSPPPLNAPMVDLKTGKISSTWHQFFNDLYRKTGESSNVAPISVEGTAATITGDLPPEQLAGPVPIDKGGTGASDAAGAIEALGVQTAISPGTPGEVPVSDGTNFFTRRLNYSDVNGVPQIEHKNGEALVPPGAAVIGSYADTTITWDTPFADSDYSLTVSCHPATGIPITSIVSKTETDCTVRVANATAVVVTGTLDAQGIHS